VEQAMVRSPTSKRLLRAGKTEFLCHFAGQYDNNYMSKDTYGAAAVIAAILRVCTRRPVVFHWCLVNTERYFEVRA
jgi:hypothetical protein